MSAHSKIGASSMSRWVACPGSVGLSDGIESESSIYAAEGTVAHEIGAECLLEASIDPYQYVGEVWPQDGYDIEITTEMIDAVNVYLDYVNGRIEGYKAAGYSPELLVEQKLHLKDIHPNAFGTSDTTIYVPEIKHLDVLDYKHGAGVPVEANGNPQLLYYSLGEAWNRAAKTIELGLVQPRCPHEDGPIRTHTITGVEMLEWAMVLEDAIKATEQPNAPIRSGDHCRWCPASAICPELRKQVMETAMKEFKDESGNYDPEELANMLEKLPMIRAWVKKVDAFAYQEATHGRCPPRHKLVAKRATRKWSNESDAEFAMANYGMDEKDIFTRKIITPPAAEKIIGKKDFASIGDVVIKESSGNVLVGADDKRPAVTVGAESEFEAV